jgi:uncharacterized protein (TIGR04255 family)
MAGTYKNSPIIEAVCEFRFEPSEAWDLTVPGLLYERLRRDFPIRRQAKQFQFRFGPGAERSNAQTQPTGRMQFFSANEKSLVQVDRDLLVVNHLKPYSTWREFLPLIHRGFDAYAHVADPNGLRRIGLRYINRIEIPGPRVELEDYFHFRPFVGAHLPQDFASFIVGMEVPYEKSRDRLRLQATTAVDQKADTVAVMLDLDYFLAEQGKIPLDSAFEWLETAHQRLEQIFEACITDRLRTMFQELPD